MTRDPEPFLAAHGWQSAARHWLQPDLSRRRYCRLTAADGRRCLLMDAPPGQEDVRPYLAVAAHLTGLGFSAPTVWAANIEAGYLLVEDFGDDSFTRVLARDPEAEAGLYDRAVDILAALHRAPVPERLAVPGCAAMPVEAFDAQRVRDQLALFGQWYLPAIGLAPEPGCLDAVIEPLIPDMLAGPPVLALRDYHVDNLMVLPRREGVRSLGLLDFQDAVAGPAAYDLMSLIQDARRDVAGADRLLARYFGQSDRPQQAFMAAYYRLGILRHLRVLGVFARAWLSLGRTDKLVHIPRLWRYLQENIEAIGADALDRRLAALVPPDARRLPPSDLARPDLSRPNRPPQSAATRS